jgi:hypothetical protein
MGAVLFSNPFEVAKVRFKLQVRVCVLQPPKFTLTTLNPSPLQYQAEPNGSDDARHYY